MNTDTFNVIPMTQRMSLTSFPAQKFCLPPTKILDLHCVMFLESKITWVPYIWLDTKIVFKKTHQKLLSMLTSDN